MIHILYGERGPRVVLLQALLRLKGHDVPMTGVFDRATWNGAVRVRAATGHRAAGPVNGPILAALLAGEGLKVIDSLDAQAGVVREVTEKDLRAAGIDPLLNRRRIGHGVADAVERIVRRAAGHRIALLRFVGHGNRGTWMSVAVGDPVHTLEAGNTRAYAAMRADWRSYINLAHLGDHLDTLGRLTRLFAPFGSVELHACKIGTQTAMIKRLADLWGVPVSGGMQNQLVGGGKLVDPHGATTTSTFIFEGPVFTACPYGLDLARWAGRAQRWVPVGRRAA